MANKDYYWCFMNNGGVCVKCYTFEEIDNAIVSGRYKDAKKIKTVKPEKKRPKRSFNRYDKRSRNVVSKNPYYQPYSMYVRALELERGLA